GADAARDDAAAVAAPAAEVVARIRRGEHGDGGLVDDVQRAVARLAGGRGVPDVGAADSRAEARRRGVVDRAVAAAVTRDLQRARRRRVRGRELDGDTVVRLVQRDRALGAVRTRA